MKAISIQHKTFEIQGGVQGYWELPMKPNITPISWPMEGGGM
jgi:hypothetical protein